jgi:hypothetical protein
MEENTMRDSGEHAVSDYLENKFLSWSRRKAGQPPRIPDSTLHHDRDSLNSARLG